MLQHRDIFGSRDLVITDTDRIHLALFGMQNRPLGPYLGTLIPVVNPVSVAASPLLKS
jgi:hypothetical protein